MKGRAQMAEPEELKNTHSPENEDLEPGSIESSRATEQDLSPPRGHAFPVVGIGGSAGGLDAFARLLQALPNDTDMAFVIVQHLDPHHTSHLAEILARSTSMPVRSVHDGLAIEPNEVYVIPPNTTMVLDDGSLRLVPRDPGLHLPVDAFFTSLARVQGSRAIGVILSGNASDGSQGVKAIKEECGLTFAQDEASAQHIGMPRNAIATGAIDYVLPPADIARELGRLSKHPYIRPQSGEPQFEVLPQGDRELSKIFSVLRDRIRVDFSHYKANTIRRRIGRRMIVKSAQTLHDYVQVLQKDPAEARELFKDFLISFTSFFRDPNAFEALAALLKDAFATRNSAEPFRVWVPGCASGEEVYSIAICLQEINDQLEMDTPLQLFGTDISDAALERARAGIYPDSIDRDVSAERLHRFFKRADRGFQISKSIRESCIFARQDLTSDPPFGHMDLISCRNLLIYLDSSLQRRVLPVFHYSLNDTGLLFLGSAESIGEASELFSAVDKQNRIYTRKPGAIRLSMKLTPHPSSASDGEDSRELAVVPGFDLQRKADLVLQSKYSPPAVVVNREFQILHFRGHTGFYLEPAPGLASLNLLRLARNVLVKPLRNIIETASARNISVQEKGIIVQHRGEKKEVTLEVTPVNGPGRDERYFIVAFKEEAGRTEPSAESNGAPTATASPEASALEASHRDLERQVLELREQLRNAQEDHEAHVEELRAANEEVRSANEELQSTNEELSTTKEELQSTNEELTTLNEELQTRNSEMNVANGDLSNLLAAVDVPFLMLDNELRLRRFSDASTKLLKIQSFDVGHPVGGISGSVDLRELIPLANGVISTLHSQEREIQDQSGRWYLVSIRPYRTIDNRIDGVVMVFFDIDTLKCTLQAAEEARDYAEGLIDTVREPLVVLDSDLRVERATSTFYEMFRVSRAETEGRFLYDLGNGQWNLPRLRELLGEALFRNQSFQDLEVEHTFPHIGRRRMRLNGKRIFPDGAHKRSVLLAIEDVTKRHEQAEARYQRMFETARDGMMICDVETETVVDVNPFFLELLGIQRDQVIGRRLGDLAAFQTSPDAATMIAEAAAKEMVRRDNLSLHGANGQPVQVDITANRYLLGSRPAVQINLRDVTSRNRATKKLRESEARLRLFVESVRDYALFQLDPNGLISSWNIGAERLLGYSEQEIIGQPFERIFTPADVAAGSPQIELENARSKDRSLDERWHLRKNGSIFFANGVLTAIRDPSGRLRGFSKIMRDITESHRAALLLKDQEQKLRASLADKEALLKEIHHRVKNNLQIIASLLDLQSEFLDQADSKAVLLEMKTRVRSIAAIHELLYTAADFSRIDFRRFIEKLAQDVIAVHRRRASRVDVEIHAESVLLDMSQAVPCGLIVNELLTNAFKHAFPEGRSGKISVSFGSDQTNWRLELSDDGMGLPADIHLENVNSMGFQLIQLLAQQLGGSLDVLRGSGTRFVLRFPRGAAPPGG
jgi:two-component system CheB/CheR fusion protein